MTYSSCLTDPDAPLILDASVLISLHASGKGARILNALPNEICVAETVAKEMQAGDGSAPAEKDFLDNLADRGVVKVVEMEGDELAIYEKYISDDRSLDDGEAATIAIAINRGYQPVIDERKACSRLAEDEPGLNVPTTVDLMFSSPVKQSLSSMDRRDAVHKALTDARMHVRSDQVDTIVELIGKRRALECNSLPKFKELKAEIERERSQATER